MVVGASEFVMSGICGGLRLWVVGLMMDGGLKEIGISGSMGLVVVMLLLEAVVWLFVTFVFVLFVVLFECVCCCLNKPIAVAYWAMVASRCCTMDCSIVGDGCNK